MNDQDYKYLLATYQQKCFDMLSQNIASDAKVRQLTDLVEALTVKVTEQKEQIDKMVVKSKRVAKQEDYN